jgi:hypothetical protein
LSLGHNKLTNSPLESGLPLSITYFHLRRALKSPTFPYSTICNFPLCSPTFPYKYCPKKFFRREIFSDDLPPPPPPPF